MSQENAVVKSIRKLSAVAITPAGKIDTYRSVVNQVKRVCTLDGSKRGASLNLYTRMIVNDTGVIVGQVFCNKSLSQEQANTYWASLS